MSYQQTLAEKCPCIDGSNCLCYMPVFPNKLGLWNLSTPVYYSKCQEPQSTQYISSQGCTAGQQWTEYSEVCDIVGRGINRAVGSSNTCFGRQLKAHIGLLASQSLARDWKVSLIQHWSSKKERHSVPAWLPGTCKVAVFSQPLFPLSGSFLKIVYS